MSSFSFIDVFVLFVMFLVFLAYVRSFYGEVEFLVSNVDGENYLVRKLPDAQEAADTLAQLNEHLKSIVQHVVAKYGETNPDIQRLYRNYNPKNVSEGGVEHGYTSYSVNKGEKLVMCIRQSNGSFVDMNTLIYVAVHELAHLMTQEVGHTPTFWQNFKFLLNEAIELGKYRFDDYARNPREYCGIKITSSVL